jgi:hypothetical protein
MPGTVAGVIDVEGDDEGLGPEALVAVTVNVVAMPAVRPLEMVHDVLGVVQLAPAGEDETVYDVTVDPPLAGAVQDTVACGLEPLAMLATLTPDAELGAAGAVDGVRLLEDAEAAPLPLPLVATTEKVYAVPAVRPDVMVQLVAAAPETVQVAPPGLAVAV